MAVKEIVEAICELHKAGHIPFETTLTPHHAPHESDEIEVFSLDFAPIVTPDCSRWPVSG
jgi:hypothetical protein